MTIHEALHLFTAQIESLSILSLTLYKKYRLLPTDEINIKKKKLNEIGAMSSEKALYLRNAQIILKLSQRPSMYLWAKSSPF